MRFAWSQYQPSKTRRDIGDFERRWSDWNDQTHPFASTAQPQSVILPLYEELRSDNIEREQLLQTIDEMLFANLDMTMGGLSWSLAFLAAYKDVQEKIRQETKEAHSSTILATSILEASRLKPLAAFSDPQSAPTDRIVNGFLVPVGINIVGTHAPNTENPCWGPDGDTYRPEPFLNDCKLSELRYRFWRFGFGPRQCLGKFVVDLIIRVIVAKLVEEYEPGFTETTQWEKHPSTWILHPDTKILCKRVRETGMKARPARFRFSHVVGVGLFLVTIYNLWSLSFPSFPSISERVNDHLDAKTMDIPIPIRPVTANDLDAIVDIVIKAFPDDEQFAYRYQYREQYPEDHYKYTKMYYSEYLDTTFAGKNTIMVAEAPDLEDPTKTKVIALSIWDNPGDREPNPDMPAVAPPKNHPERKDCNRARLKAHSEATMKARKEIFVAKFGEKQLSLRQIATLPEYRGRGAASELLKWGMERAKKERVALPMFAGKMGKRLYLNYGFKELGRVEIQAPGEEEVIYESAMAWDPRGEGTTSSLD
ncbi:hypothetical protein O1611_g2213 [Lasiodiplodia mahajangana]|uniref:Uncharacterized protein n=1 Tax=Lasiodiplodia mahajangana TaxID=1108764 RepID=A0ACC2JVP8_9PEZI|nr:hypothetical protein O1611_g2213 [Lasiodiplodia mahajangana]